MKGVFESHWREVLSPEEWVNLKLSVGTHRPKRRLSPIEVTEHIQRVLDGGATKSEISEEIDVSVTQIRGFLRLNRLPSKFESLVIFGRRKGKLSFSQASFSMGLKDSSEIERVFLLEKVLEERLSKDEIKAIERLKNRADLTLEQVINEVLNDRVLKVKRNMMIGFIEDDVKSIINTLDVETRGLEFKKLLNTVFPLVEIYSAKIDANRFSLTTDEFGQTQIELKARKENVNYNSLIMINIRKTWGDA